MILVLQRFSNSLWENIKINYDSASKIIDIQDLLNAVEDQQNLDNLFLAKEIVIYVLLGLMLVYNIVTIMIAFFVNKPTSDAYDTLDNIRSSIICCEILIIIIGVYIPFISVPSHQIFSNVNDYYNDIKDFDNQGTNQSFAFVKHINNDKKYFYNSKGKEDKAEFDKLSLANIRNLKIYYSNSDTNDEYNTYIAERNKIGVWTKDAFAKEKVNSWLGKSPLAWWQWVIDAVLILILFLLILPTLTVCWDNRVWYVTDAIYNFYERALRGNTSWFYNLIFDLARI